MKTIYRELSNALEELLKERLPIIEPAPTEYRPLFLLCTVKPDVLGFATLDNQSGNGYLSVFQNFRDLYSIRSDQWADFELSLVFCKSNTLKVTDELCNLIEMNPYFCRKFVIDLEKDLKTELARLPFIPLSPERTVGFGRPITAQTFLIKHGLTAMLAKYLAVPHARGTERIIDECLEGNLGKPSFSEALIEEFSLPEPEVRPKVHVKSLEINNVRAYRENHKFELDSNLVVLFGPNGFGKTSFFDAIDFACTGGVGRFDERFARKTDRLINALKHLDSPIEDSFVKMTILHDNKEILLERYMKDRTQTLINGEVRDRTETLLALTGLPDEPPDLRIENLIRLFRATHLFGQEYQSLTLGFKERSTLPEDTISRMLALQDYVESINKARYIFDELLRRIKDKSTEITSLNVSLKSGKAELDQIRQTAEILKEPDIISAEGMKLREKVSRQLNIPIEISMDVERGTIRRWRGVVEAEIVNITQKTGLIKELENKLPGIANHRRQMEEKTSKLAQRKALLLQLGKDYADKKKVLAESEEKHNRMLIEQKNLLVQRENRIWVAERKLEYDRLKEHLGVEKRNYNNFQEQLYELIPNIKKLEEENRFAGDSANKVSSDIRLLENNLRELDDFYEGISDWEREVKIQKDSEAHLREIQHNIENAQNILQPQKNELNNALIAQEKLEKVLGNLEKSRSELKTLLDHIERHVVDNICPVCGSVHKSREELIEKLKYQRGFQPVQIREALQSFKESRLKIEDMEGKIKALELSIRFSTKEYRESQNRIVTAGEKIKPYEEKAISLKIGSSLEELRSVINSRKEELMDEINGRRQVLSDLRSEMKKRIERIIFSVNTKASLEEKLGTTKSKLGQIESALYKIREDALNRQVSLEVDNEIISEGLKALSVSLKNLNEQIEKIQGEYVNLQRLSNDLLEKRKVLEMEVAELEREASYLKKYLDDVETLLRRLGLDKEIGLDQIMVFKKEVSDKLTQLEALRTEVNKFEITWEALQTSAAALKVQKEVEYIEKQLVGKKEELNQLKKWLSFYSEVGKELGILRNRAINGYIDKFGPLSSTIQKRLRSVYGFGEINLHTEKGGIAIRVERKGEKHIYPSDYFSESQVQIVMLSLFLSATLTQTWSTFTPILVDDPVTHFDDLNAYSLLDLIRGLITDTGKGNQFIVSTCDDRLFRLMRQKFSKMNSKVIFYLFESIGERGPKITRM